MADYYWRPYSGFELGHRFVDSARGYGQWVIFIEEIKKALAASDPQSASILAFERFVVSTDLERQSPRELRLFISHRMGKPDEDYARRIAWIAYGIHCGYWVDVEDPVLPLISGAPIPLGVRNIIIAAIIEMALLNCSHVAAAMTLNSAPSRWIPYEYGRVKEKNLRSVVASVWLASGISERDCGEYVLLGAINRSRSDIENWITNTKSGFITVNPMKPTFIDPGAPP